MNTLIVDIKRNSLDDGPGIRTLIFFKGCPLSCVWCQNPEAKSSKQEISFDKEICSFCGKCAEVCETNAINLDYIYRINREICNLCGKCVDFCPNHAYELVGKFYDIDELIKIILKDKVFFKNSGGGVTLSGGEPTLHMNYMNKLLQKLKKHKIHVCLETCGYFNLSKFKELILPYLDLIYFDLKLLDPALHEKYCGVSNELILQNFKYLINETEVELLPRIPLIPNITTDENNLKSFAQFLKSNNINKVHLLPYNPLWLSKPEKIGVKLEYNHSEMLKSDQKEQIKTLFSDFEYNQL